MSSTSSKFWRDPNNNDDDDESCHSDDSRRSDNEDDEMDSSSLDDNNAPIIDRDDPNRAWSQLQTAQEGKNTNRQRLFLPVPTTTITSNKESSTTDDMIDRRSNVTRFVIISDTHGKHRQLHLPRAHGNVLIHGGDFSKTGEIGTIEDLSCYFGSLLKSSHGDKDNTVETNSSDDDDNVQQKFDSIICIAGNHDMSLHREYYLNENNWRKGTLPSPHRNPRRFQQRQEDVIAARCAIEKNCHYLEDSTYVTKDGIVIYGSPWSPIFFGWGFNANRGDDIDSIWSKIPDETDVLITHGPPLGRGDMSHTNGRAGCYDLLMHIQNRVKPRISIFGHIHEGYGTEFDGQTLFVNGSSCNLNYEVHENLPIVIDLPHDRSSPAMVVQPNCKLLTVTSLIEYCDSVGIPELANAFRICDDPKKLPLGNDLLDLDGIHRIVEAFREAKVDRLTNLHRQLLREFRPKLYADSFS